MTDRPPAAVRRAGLVVAVEGIAALAMAVALVVVGSGSSSARMAFGTAGWFALVGGGVLAAGWALWTGRRWGRGPAVFIQLLLLPVALAVGFRQPLHGLPVAVVAIATLALLFSGPAQRWVAGVDESADSGKAGPDNR